MIELNEREIRQNIDYLNNKALYLNNKEDIKEIQDTIRQLESLLEDYD